MFARLGGQLNIVHRPKGSEGWVKLPIRWTVERTFAWLGRCRRLTKDREKTVVSWEASIVVVAISTLLSGPQPPDTVLMPDQAQGWGRTGLKTRCAAVPSWIEVVDPLRIGPIIGHAPPKQLRAIAEILRRFAEADPAMDDTASE